MIESLLLAVVRITAVAGDRDLSNSTGFFFEREGRLYLITNHHVVHDEPTGHRPDLLRIDLHTSPENAVETIPFLIPLYSNSAPVWRQGIDAGGDVDVVAIELDRAAMPEKMLIRGFSPDHLVGEFDKIEVGRPLLIVAFPLGFHDTLHHLPVARNAIVASSFGIRFQGNGYFLTDARMHRGTSGAPVVTRSDPNRSGRDDLPWILLGIHSARLDVTNRDAAEDERLMLNCAWYADILMSLTNESTLHKEPPPQEPEQEQSQTQTPDPAQGQTQRESQEAAPTESLDPKPAEEPGGKIA